MIHGKSAYCVNVSGDILTIGTRGKIEKFDVLGAKVLAGRGEIAGFSASSRYRMRRFLRETETDYRTFITLTYPGDVGKNDDRASKNDLRVFIQRIRRDVEGRNDKRFFSAFWFIEFQARGAIHYHLFCTHGFGIEFMRSAWADCVVRRFDKAERESKRCRGLWNAAYASGSRIETVRAGRKGIQSYAAKYASKNEQKLIPVDFFSRGVGRFWGVCGRGIALSASTVVMEEFKSSKIAVSWLETWDKGMRRMLYAREIEDLTEKIPDLPNGMYVFRIESREKAREIAVFIKRWEVINTILDKRTHCRKMTDEEMEMHYRELWDMPHMREFKNACQ